MAASSGPSTKTIARVFLTVVLLAAGLYVLYRVRTIIGLVVIAIFLAVALGPAVDLAERKLNVKRGLAIVVTYLAMLLAVVGVGTAVVPPIVTQVNGFAHHVPTYIREAQKNPTIRRYDHRYHIFKKLEQQAKNLPAKLADAAGALQAVTVGVFSAIVQLITVLTLTFFLLLDRGGMFHWITGFFDTEREERIRAVANDVYRAVAGYVAGNLIISLIAGTFTYVTLTILGVPFAVPLAVFYGFVDIIPIIGSAIGAIGVGLVTLFHDFPTATIVWTILALIYQQVENNVLQPVVYRRTVDVAPMFVILSVLVGTTLLGVLGALLSIPVAAAIQIIFRDYWYGRRRPSGIVVVDENATPEEKQVELPPETIR